MKVFISHSSNFDYKKSLYEPIKSHIGAAQEFIYPHDTDEIANSKEAVISSDMVLAEVSYPSTGQGIELGWADEYGVPIVAIYQSGMRPSGALSAVGVSPVGYDSVEQLLSVIQTAIDGLKTK